LSYNNTATSTTDISPFFTNYGYHLSTPSGPKRLKPISEQVKI
jgi:hypothetical protein